jgi:hypothetical protein
MSQRDMRSSFVHELGSSWLERDQPALTTAADEALSSACMRWSLAASLGLGLGLAHACSDDGFECHGDEECTLAGEPGRCVEGGRCAYPHPQCPSGLAYPQGAPEGLAGECVPPHAASAGTGDATAATSEPGSSGGTTGGAATADDGSSSGAPGASVP